MQVVRGSQLGTDYPGWFVSGSFLPQDVWRQKNRLGRVLLSQFQTPEMDCLCFQKGISIFGKISRDHPSSKNFKGTHLIMLP